MGHIKRESLPKSKMASSGDRSCMCCVLETGLTRNFAADLSLQIFNNHSRKGVIRNSGRQFGD